MFGKCPLLLLQEQWEWQEQAEELGNIAIYEQVRSEWGETQLDLTQLRRCVTNEWML